MRVGFIGLGNLGRPMAQRLLVAGYELTVHSLGRAAVDELARAGAHPAESPREVVEAVDVVLTALPSRAAVESVYLGAEGLCRYAGFGQVLVDHSTVDPDIGRRIAAAARARGAEMLDAPVSGGPEGAERGELAIMVGGRPEAFERARPLFETLGRYVRLVGPSGAGSAMKLINQVLVTIHSAATAEALALAERAGADPVAVLDMILAGLAASAIFDRNARRIIRRDFAPGARIDLMVKDAGLARELCDRLGLRLPVFARAGESFEQALNRGYGQDDLAGIIRLLEPEPDP